jgi:hypothetical protein
MMKTTTVLTRAKGITTAILIVRATEEAAGIEPITR